jgi:hypothetical protein
MKTRVLIFVLIFILTPIYSSVFALQRQIQISDSVIYTVNGKELKKETRTIIPNKRGLVTNEIYLSPLLEYAPDGFVCGYVMRNSSRQNLWGIFLVKKKNRYSLVYKESEQLTIRKIKSDLAATLELSVYTQISKIEFDINHPVFTYFYGGLPETLMDYNSNIVFTITPSRAAYFRAQSEPQGYGINDIYWQTEIDLFQQRNK